MDRFFSEIPLCGEDVREAIVTLVEEESHRLIHVLRGKVGDRIELFDGMGVEATGVVEHLTRREVQVRLEAIRRIDRECDVPLTLAVALPKGDRQRFLVEKLTELGVTRLIPMTTQRSVATAERGTLSKLRRTVVEASRQCRRNRLMEITEPFTWKEVMAWCCDHSGPRVLWLAHPDAAPIPMDAATGTCCEWIAAIGPEGGFTDEEVAQGYEMGFQGVSLGRTILRIETAAMTIAAIGNVFRQRHGSAHRDATCYVAPPGGPSESRRRPGGHS